MAAPAPAASATPLKYSDYLQAGAITAGLLGGSAFIGLIPSTYTAGLAGLAGIFAALSQFLQSKGD